MNIYRQFALSLAHILSLTRLYLIRIVSKEFLSLSIRVKCAFSNVHLLQIFGCDLVRAPLLPLSVDAKVPLVVVIATAAPPVQGQQRDHQSQDGHGRHQHQSDHSAGCAHVRLDVGQR